MGAQREPHAENYVTMLEARRFYTRNAKDPNAILRDPGQLNESADAIIGHIDDALATDLHQFQEVGTGEAGMKRTKPRAQ